MVVPWVPLKQTTCSWPLPHCQCNVCIYTPVFPVWQSKRIQMGVYIVLQGSSSLLAVYTIQHKSHSLMTCVVWPLTPAGRGCGSGKSSCLTPRYSTPRCLLSPTYPHAVTVSVSRPVVIPRCLSQTKQSKVFFFSLSDSHFSLLMYSIHTT